VKVVINDCFGGFGLSPAGLKAWAKRKGRECYFFEYGRDRNGGLDIHKLVPTDNPDSLFYSAYDLPDIEKFDDKHFISDFDIERTDSDLIAVVEEMGDAANGRCSKLKIVEIPDGIEWQIEEYDGTEWVSEKHRTWS